MAVVANGKLDDSLKTLRDLNRQSLEKLNKEFSRRMDAELRRSGSPVRDRLVNSVRHSWEVRADRHIGAVPDYIQKQLNLIVLSLQFPMGTLEVLTGIKRAGADMIITYFAPDVAQWLKDG